MQAGDILFLHTDGITEARNGKDELFGMARLCNILTSKQSEPPEAILEAVLLQVSEFTGTTTMEDDVTMVTMKVV